MRKLLVIFIIVLSPYIITGQNLDSLYSDFIRLKSPQKEIGLRTSEYNKGRQKCAFGLVTEVKLNYNKFTAAQREVLSALFNRPVLAASILSPSGKFRIHYDNSGANKPSFDLYQFALAADSAYNFEVNILGFPAPPSDGTNGDDAAYDIYIKDLQGYYGYTEIEDVTQQGYYTSYMVIENDFAGFYTTGLNAARVTVAHEFHHAIQLGSYTYRSADKYYHELTSTSMEEFVFDYVNDYLLYLSDYFDNPGAGISAHEGYDMAIFNIFLKERFGIQIIKKIWEYINSYRALEAISRACQDNNSEFFTEFSAFAKWTFYTGRRTVPGEYFKDAANYPLLKPAMNLTSSALNTNIIVNSYPVSNTILLYVNNAGGRNDSIYAFIVNSDFRKGFETPYSTEEFTYKLAASDFSGSKKISPDYFSLLTSGSISVLKDINFINNVYLGSYKAEEAGSPFPQPFNYNKHSSIAVPVPQGQSKQAELNIYTVSMHKVFSGNLEVRETNRIFVRWNGLSDTNSRLPNGVYFYAAHRDGSTLTGKLVIQND